MNYYNYFTEIEETFVRRRARNLFLSPLDWALMEVWQQKGIPLHIVIRGIEQVFDNFEKNPGPRSIKGLMFCREEVEAQYGEWLTAQTGKSNGVSESTPTISFSETTDHINGLIESLRLNNNSDLSEEIERACVRLAEVAENVNGNLEQLDRSLGDIEDLLDNALLAKADENKRQILEKEIDAHLKPYKSTMDKVSYEMTFRLMLLKQLREAENIPRLSLFYL